MTDRFSTGEQAKPAKTISQEKTNNIDTNPCKYANTQDMTTEPAHYLTPQKLAALLGIRDGIENLTLEVKRATGKDGKGEIPSDFYPTYSAFANTLGGIVVLGLEEKKSGDNFIYKIAGIREPDKLIDKLSSDLNNNTKVSRNCVAPDGIQKISAGDAWIIVIRIEKADRTEKPVYLNGNPINNTYIRRASGDCPASEEDVRYMIRDAAARPDDEEILSAYTSKDLNPKSVLSYRNLFRSSNPSHRWNTLSDEDFLEKIKAINTSREKDISGVTRAGLLMFGYAEDITNIYPFYYVDYIEKYSADSKTRYDNRISSNDGTWSGNLCDYFIKVLEHLSEDLPTPFRLHGAQRIDENPKTEVLREALTNTIIHADYTDRAPVKIEKYPDKYVFTNPGHMRRPLRLAIEGGISDCRNRLLQNMFGHIGFGDQEGFGISSIIYEIWEAETNTKPEYLEKTEPRRTVLILRGLSDSHQTRNLNTDNKEHQTALTGNLNTDNKEHQTTLTRNLNTDNMEHQTALTGNLNTEEHQTEYTEKRSGDKMTAGHRDELISTFSKPLQNKIFTIGKRASPETMFLIIREICAERDSTLEEISLILNRKNKKDIYNRYLSPLLSEGKIIKIFPENPHHPNQKYRAVLTAKNTEKKK